MLCTPNMSWDGFSGSYSRSVGGVYLRDGGAFDVTKFTTEYHDTSDNGNNNDLQPTYSYPNAVMTADVTGYQVWWTKLDWVTLS
ncbi:hypothetical protein [Sphingomonas crocodyli]|uniref:hypothetical protein n=1 Tax=Sphingomonas crocodyli TaxID=1979270 RepID=UPI0013E383E0|nr:hypothetical protein [Sphingomonas crocodyli]